MDLGGGEIFAWHRFCEIYLAKLGSQRLQNVMAANKPGA